MSASRDGLRRDELGQPPRYHGLMAASPDLDRVVRHRVYSALAAAERAPNAAALALSLRVEVADVRAALERLHAAHALVLDAATREVRMALPFSNGTTSYRVESGDRAWDANCAWDALALVRLLDLRQG